MLKPGDAPVNVPPPTNTKINVNTNKTVNIPQNTVNTSSGFNFFDEPTPQTTSTSVPQTQTTQNNNQINFNQVQPSSQLSQPNGSLPFGQFQLPQQKQPQQPVQPQVSSSTQGNSLYANQLSGFNFNTQPNVVQQPNQASLLNQQLNFGYQNQPQQSQQINFNTNPQSNQGLLGFGNITMNPTQTQTPAQNKQMFTMNAPTNNKEDEFGGFNQGHK